jgi:hypothetical protein
VRRATEADLPALVRLRADDPLGGSREAVTDGEADLAPYRRALALIAADPPGSSCSDTDPGPTDLDRAS